MQLPSCRSVNLVQIPISVLLLLLLLHQCSRTKIIPATLPANYVHDTSYITSNPVEIKTPVPVIRYIHTAQDSELYTVLGNDSSYSPYMQGYKDTVEALMKMRHTCRDTAYYIDTITSPDSWKLILAESVTGNRIINRKPLVQDLRPVITTTITTQIPPPKEHIRFYGGADVSINATYPARWGISLAGILTIPQGFAFRYGYDLRNNAHTAGAYVLIKARK